MVEFQPSKLAMRVRFPLPAPNKNELIKRSFFVFIKMKNLISLNFLVVSQLIIYVKYAIIYCDEACFFCFICELFIIFSGATAQKGKKR